MQCEVESFRPVDILTNSLDRLQEIAVVPEYGPNLISHNAAQYNFGTHMLL
jgi:acetolactate synthase regulatory subunit